jgi:hypothetical protein
MSKMMIPIAFVSAMPKLVNIIVFREDRTVDRLPKINPSESFQQTVATLGYNKSPFNFCIPIAHLAKPRQGFSAS